MEDFPDFAALAADAEGKANSAESLRLAALWRELAQTYRELSVFHQRRAELTAAGEEQVAPASRGGVIFDAYMD